MFNRHAFTVVFVSFFIVATSLVTASWQLFYRHLQTNNTTVIQLKINSTAQQFAYRLKRQGLFNYPKLLTWFLQLTGNSEHLQAGFYQIDNTTTVWQLTEKIIAGDVIKKDFTIIAGTNLVQLLNQLNQADYLSSRAPQLNHFKYQHLSAEGLFLAETYQYIAGSDQQVLLKKANGQLLELLNGTWLNRDEGLPYKNSYELLIAASIIEKETGLEHERGLISGVIVNRLSHDMKLQMDPTVIYAIEANFDGKIRKNDLKNPSPYNTYAVKGLPPTPIAMVGRRSLSAAAHPVKSSYYYFVANGQGGHVFSVDYQAHQQAVSHYRRISQRGK